MSAQIVPLHSAQVIPFPGPARPSTIRMRVDLYDGDAAAPWATNVALWECLPDDVGELARVIGAIERCGEALVGGGAAPLTIIRPSSASGKSFPAPRGPFGTRPVVAAIEQRVDVYLQSGSLYASDLDLQSALIAIGGVTVEQLAWVLEMLERAGECWMHGCRLVVSSDRGRAA